MVSLSPYIWYVRFGPSVLSMLDLVITHCKGLPSEIWLSNKVTSPYTMLSVQNHSRLGTSCLQKLSRSSDSTLFCRNKLLNICRLHESFDHLIMALPFDYKCPILLSKVMTKWKYHNSSVSFPFQLFLGILEHNGKWMMIQSLFEDREAISQVSSIAKSTKFG